MKALNLMIAAAGLTVLTIGPAYANSCQDEIAKVKQAYNSHLHQRGGKDAMYWRSTEQAIAAAEKSCAESRATDAFKQVNQANRWLGLREHSHQIAGQNDQNDFSIR